MRRSNLAGQTATAIARHSPRGGWRRGGGNAVRNPMRVPIRTLCVHSNRSPLAGACKSAAVAYFFHLSERNMWLLKYLICAFFIITVSAQKFKSKGKPWFKLLSFFSSCLTYVGFSNEKNNIYIALLECTNCVDDGSSGPSNSRWTMPLQKLGDKQYYLGIFFKVSKIILIFIITE